MGIAISTYYYKPKGKKLSDMDLAERIEKIALGFPSYGYRRITAALHRDKIKVNHKRVLRLMRDKNLLCRVRKAFMATADSSHGLVRYPNLIWFCNKLTLWDLKVSSSYKFLNRF